jgi:ATP-dependent Clp protease adaptor protein ClpS
MAAKEKTKGSPFIEEIRNAGEDKYQSLILHNDEVNNFDFVIECLIDICHHSALQAEQCTMLVHYKGKCDVKSGSYDTLDPMRLALLDRGLQATID